MHYDGAVREIVGYIQLLWMLAALDSAHLEGLLQSNEATFVDLLNSGRTLESS